MRLAYLFIFVLSFLRSNSTEISGHNPEYAGKTLKFYQYSDPVTREKTPAFTIEIDARGNFNASVNNQNTIFVFCEFGIYRGNLFIEPNKSVDLLLPPLREKTFAEERNPYFSPVEFWFATGQEQNLNDKISSFENQLNTLTDKYFNQLYYNKSRNAFDSLQTNIKRQFPEEDSGIFNLHKKWRLKTIKADVFRQEAAKITPELLNANQSEWTYPAFIQLFDKAFEGKLSYAVKSSGDHAIPKAISGGDIRYLQTFVEQNHETIEPLTALALLKMLHDAYYSGDFSRERIFNLINNSYFTKSEHKAIPAIAQNVIEKLTHLKKGTKAPEICLKDINGHNVCTSGNEGKYKYLLFADTEMAVVREQLKYLTRINELFGNHLEIFTIHLKTDLIEMKQFLTEEKIPGTHLVDNEGKYIDIYKVKSFPSAYLLNSNHEVIFEETRAPLDGFEQQFGPFLQKERFLQQRNQSR